MPKDKSSSIGLSELIQQVRAELLLPRKDEVEDRLYFYVESIELELQVVLSRDAKAGIKVDVLSVGGAEIGGGIDQDRVQKVHIKLSPLYSKEEIKKYFHAFRSKEVLPSINTTLDKVIVQNIDMRDAEGRA